VINQVMCGRPLVSSPVVVVLCAGPSWSSWSRARVFSVKQAAQPCAYDRQHPAYARGHPQCQRAGVGGVRLYEYHAVPGARYGAAAQQAGAREGVRRDVAARAVAEADAKAQVPGTDAGRGQGAEIDDGLRRPGDGGADGSAAACTAGWTG
jgi:hypothetical protein